ncbi:TauD/TfdA dioxygenase family protein [Sabulicella glaciei]|uniref:TauD/TfdA family dioxygenase n=1 Tax=Sabulicella glaciei TaxID=2984948 RepID=A0ABT3NTQ0_9PROT|nr:TauD/TfdA family dioxygenase [Roseococcus sp. MDT2-1-1]MCW8085537.1 TauD/TfdA family dioxygenase [Roseococcus sp. MDT2-1-1]
MKATLQIRPVTPSFVAEVSGIDLRKPVTPDVAAEIDAAMDTYAALVFRDQALGDAEQRAFGEALGTIEATRATVDAEKTRLQDKTINDISNLAPDGTILAADARRRMFNLGNQLWHSDSSFKAIPAKYSMLHARVIPPSGGATEVADMRAAWDALDPDMQEKLRDLICEHSLLFSRQLLGFTEFTEVERASFAPVQQRLVRYFPATGRRSLYLSAHIGRIVGWPVPEALALIRDLMEHATERRFVYSHAWRVNDLLMWDNRTTMHRGRPYDDKRYPRDMRRVTLMDVASTLQQAA